MGTAILAFLITVFTLGICYPFAVVLLQRWRCKHTFVFGRPLRFYGSAVGLFGHWLLWLFLMFITLGIYSFWVVPRMTRWIVVNTDFDATHGPAPERTGFGSAGAGEGLRSRSRPR